MQAPVAEACQDCARPLFDAGDELVCPGCGLVKEKSVAAAVGSAEGKLPLYGRQPLGSYMGTKTIGARDRYSRVSGNCTSYERMKVLSDHAAREKGYADCGRLVERVGERLYLPRVAVLQAASLSKRMMESPHRRRLTVTDVSAYSLVVACKVEGVTSVSIREIIGAFADLGRKVTSSAIFKLALESPIRVFGRTPEDYLSRVTARLSMNRRLLVRLEKDGVHPAGYLDSLRRLAGELLGRCERASLAGKRPCALAAAATYSAEALMAAREGRGLRLTQRECSRCGDASEYSVREQCAKVFGPVVAMMRMEERRTLLLQAER